MNNPNQQNPGQQQQGGQGKPGQQGGGSRRASSSSNPVKADSRAGSRSPASRAASVSLYFLRTAPRLSPGVFLCDFSDRRQHGQN